jgi:hypothetical protein
VVKPEFRSLWWHVIVESGSGGSPWSPES